MSPGKNSLQKCVKQCVKMEAYTTTFFVSKAVKCFTLYQYEIATELNDLKLLL